MNDLVCTRKSRLLAAIGALTLAAGAPLAAAGDNPAGGGDAAGACCIGAGGVIRCAELSAADCGTIGGAYQGDGTNCPNHTGCGDVDPPPPPPPPAYGGCCVTFTGDIDRDGDEETIAYCITVTEDHCTLVGGDYQGDNNYCPGLNGPAGGVPGLPEDVCDTGGGPGAIHAKPGDMNMDGLLNFFDIDMFVTAVLDTPNFNAVHPDGVLQIADVNSDGVVNMFDVDPFVNALLN